MILTDQREAQILSETQIVLRAIDRHRREAIADGRCNEASAMGGLWAGVSMMAQSVTARHAHNNAA